MLPIPELNEECEYGCVAGSCIASDCVDVDLDGYDTCSFGETGDDGNPVDDCFILRFRN